MFWNKLKAIFAKAIIALTMTVCICYIKYKKKFYHSFILVIVVLIEIILLCVFWDRVEGIINTDNPVEWMKGLLILVLAAIPVYLVWHWRKVNKKETLSQGQKDLNLNEVLTQGQKDLNSKETLIQQLQKSLELEEGVARTKFIEYQETAEDKGRKHSEETRVSAIYALGGYYEYEETRFQYQVHEFFNNFLCEFWDKQETYLEYLEFIKKQNLTTTMFGHDTGTNVDVDVDVDVDATLKMVEKLKEIDLPKYIKAVHKIIVLKSKTVKMKNKNLFFHDVNSLSFCRSNFICADLRQANLTGIHLSETNLTNANLSKANLTDAYLTLDNLTNANLMGANLTNATLANNNFSIANLMGANLTNAILARAILAHANLTNANLMGANLIYANLVAANLDGANLSGATYNKATKMPDGFDYDKAGMIKDD